MRIACFFLAALASGAAYPQWESVVQNLPPRPIGPSVMSGRIVDLAVYEKDPRIFYVASASGGLFRSNNYGLTFSAVFDRAATVSLGCVGISQKNPDVVWVGTGEATSRNSVGWGDGVYKSTDGGKTWANMGLKETMHVSEIIVDPRNDDVVYVAALGRLWGPNPERGVFKTTDGGKTWQHVLKIDERTGIGDLAMDPHNPNVLLAGAWERLRKAYDFTSGGPGSAIYRTSDGGKTWQKMTRGLPATTMGRTGFGWSRSKKGVVYATVENRDSSGQPAPNPQAGGRVMPATGGGTYRSNDGGVSWTRMSNRNPRPFYFSTIKVDPNDPDRVYLLAINLDLSTDGGKTWKTMDVRVHPDYHTMWIDPSNSNTLIVGTDGGVFLSRDKGEKWSHANSLAVGQYYAISHDMRRPYWIYGGLQDNQSWGSPSQGRQGSINFWDANGLGGGDGFFTAVDPEDWTTVYWESQGGAIVRTDLRTGRQRGIRPRIEGEALRFNWSAPFFISPHNPRTLYMGANRLFKTVNRGDTWKPVSPDLTTNDKTKQQPGRNSVTPENTGAEAHCTITTTAESPVQQGVLWVGTDDGLVHVSQDDGVTWTNVAANIPDLPANTWCSRVAPSRFVLGRCYATFDGHRNNDFKPYVYVTEDFGKTWTKLHDTLPEFDSVYVICEGQRNPDLLFLGSEMSLRVSLDRGKTWTRITTGFPTVAVHDLKIHPRELDLIIATHGRALWTMDVGGLEQLNAEALASEAALFRPQDVLVLGRTAGLGPWIGDDNPSYANTQPGTLIQFWLKADQKVTLSFADATGQSPDNIELDGKAGLNTYRWLGRLRGRNLETGDYRVALKVGDKEYVVIARVVDANIHPDE